MDKPPKKRLFHWLHAALPVLALAVVALLSPLTVAAATVNSILWDSKQDYNRFILEFNELPKYNTIDSIREKGFFYVDIYGVDTSYRRRQMKVDDNVLSYVEAVCYPEQNVLRFVFFLKNPDATFTITASDKPARLVVDTVRNKAISIDKSHFAAGKATASQQATTLQPSVPGAPPNTSVSGAEAGGFVPAMPAVRARTSSAGKGRKKYVIIDPGHGGANSGATSNATVGGKRVQEKDVVFQFAYHLKKIIDASPNMVAFLTRSDDRTLSLEERIDIAERQKGDVFVSIHCNDGNGNNSARGVEFYYLNEKGTVAGAEKAVAERENLNVGANKSTAKGSTPLVKTILTDMARAKLEDWMYEGYIICKRLEQSYCELPFYRNFNRGVKSANFSVLKNYSMPAILLEVGFMTNSEDLKYIVNPQFQRDTAIMTYNALNNYFAENDKEFVAHRMKLPASGRTAFSRR